MTLSEKAKLRIENVGLLTIPSILVIAVFAIAGFLSGCAQVQPGGLNATEGAMLSGAVAAVVPAKVNATVTNDLAVLSRGGVQAACGIIQVAQAYFDTVKPKVSTTALRAEAAAEKVVADICNNPPTDTTSAIAALFKEWTVIQAATTVPTASN